MNQGAIGWVSFPAHHSGEMTTPRIAIAAPGAALLIYIGLVAAPRAAAQGVPMSRPISPTTVAGDSTIAYPQLT
ncbi:MAG: hypothetical protein QOK07_1964, partial [Gemmatimonadaceae bacterium]|nr:hypothetical protein [Gemmatimonadaceae bacterium]